MLLATAGAAWAGGAKTNGLPLATPTWEKLPITSQSRPYMGDLWTSVPVGLAKYGYVEDEYLVSGPARVYRAVPNSDYEVDVINESTYTTRALVRRPRNMRKWSGDVVVEYLNATDGFGAPINWRALYPEILESNDVYVGFVGKPNAIPILQQFDPQRYARLDFPNPLPPDQQTCGRLPSDPNYNPNTSKLYENGLLWDLWSQIGLSLRSNDSPLGRAAKRAFAAGESQSASALYNYYYWFGGKRTTIHGKPIYDGNLSEDAPGAPPVSGALNQCGGSLPASDPQRRSDVIPDRGTPFFALNSQPLARPTPPPPSGHYRLWDIVGADHVDRQMYDRIWPNRNDVIRSRLAGPGAFPWQTGFGATELANFSPAGWFCDDASRPEVGAPQVQRRMYIWLKAWAANKRKQPPVAPYFARDASGGLIFDGDGNALGGVRLPYIEAPIATYRGVVWDDCNLFHVPFSAERLAQLFPTHEDYVAKVKHAAREAVHRGYLVREDAIDMVDRAIDRPIP